MAVTGLILAGGRATRMGSVDKGLQRFRGEPLIQHAMKRLSPQVNALLISANRNLGEYAAFGVPVCTDEWAESAGPLAGLQAGLRQCATDLLLTVSCDSPFLPEDLAERLHEELSQKHADIAVAVTESGHMTQVHPVFCLLKVELLPSLSAYLQSGGRKMREWQSFHKLVHIQFPDKKAFCNLNTLEELRSLER